MTTQILNSNYSDSSLVASVTATSEASGFPKENVLNLTRRTRAWRSGGYFEVVEGQNTIVFEETSGTPLTATIPANGYASLDLLGQEIKTQMELVGSSVYTLSQDSSTLKAKVVSNGAGGAGIFNIIWTSAGGIGDILGFDTSTDDLASLSYTADSLRISTGEFFLFDFGMGLNPDAVVVSWRSDEVNSLNETTTLELKGNHTDNFDTFIYSSSSVKTDYGFFVKKEDGSDGLATEALRFWKLELTDIDSPKGFMEIGSIFIGQWIGFSRGQVQFPFNASWEDGTISQISDGGQAITQTKYLTRTFDANWTALTQAEKEEFDVFYDEVRRAQPFYIMIDPNQVVGSTVERHVIYVRFDATPTWTLERPNYYTVNARFREDI